MKKRMILAATALIALTGCRTRREAASATVADTIGVSSVKASAIQADSAAFGVEMEIDTLWITVTRPDSSTVTVKGTSVRGRGAGLRHRLTAQSVEQADSTRAMARAAMKTVKNEPRSPWRATVAVIVGAALTLLWLVGRRREK